ncbi:MAG: shikimate dehydrogenase [Saonia sp.]
MEKIGSTKNRFGLIGRNISFSFSKGYFTRKFLDLSLNDHTYENFDLQEVGEFKNLIKNTNDLKGLNVTIPYKEAILPYLKELHPEAEKIGAVNTIKFTEKGLKGYNTDVYGFQKSIEPLLEKWHTKALLLGTGGASKAVAFVFETLGIQYTFVSRKPENHQLSYKDLNGTVLKEYTVLVNCTPLGTYPRIDDKPDIPYTFIGKQHLLFDLIYNPARTAFLEEGAMRKAAIHNGLRMLELQAEKAWEIWNS